ILIRILVVFVVLIFVVLIFVLLILIIFVLIGVILLLLLLLEFLLCVSQVIPGFVVFGIIQERLLVRFDALFQFLRFQQGIAQVVVSLCLEGLVGSRSGDIRELPDGLVQLLLFIPSRTEVEIPHHGFLAVAQ